MRIGSPPDLISQAVQELIGQTDPKILPEHTYLCDHCTGYGQNPTPRQHMAPLHLVQRRRTDMSDYCPFCHHETALVDSASSDGWNMYCTECGRQWICDIAGVVIREGVGR